MKEKKVKVASGLGSAEAAHVLEGETFTSEHGFYKEGTMENNGAVNKTLDAGEEYTVPAGYHNGSGKVASKSLENQTAVDSGMTAAAAEQILTGHQAWVNGKKVTGTMANNGAVNQSLAANGAFVIPEGYHNGEGTVSQTLTTKGEATYTPKTTAQVIAKNQYLTGAQTIEGDANLVSGNIRSGVSIFGVAGNSNVVDTSSGDAAAGNILSGKKAYVDGKLVTGSMANRGAVSENLEVNGTYVIPAGYHNGEGTVSQSLTTKAAATYTPKTTNQTIAANQYLTGVQTIKGDTNLVSSNIKSGVSIFGVSGSSNVVDTSGGDATAAQILSGKKAYVDGNLVTGSMTNRGAVSATVEAGASYTIPAGYHNGSGKVEASGSGQVVGALYAVCNTSAANVYVYAQDETTIDTSILYGIYADYSTMESSPHKTNTQFITISSAGLVTFKKAGKYVIQISATFSTDCKGKLYMENNGTETQLVYYDLLPAYTRAYIMEKTVGDTMRFKINRPNQGRVPCLQVLIMAL